jgi:hypothetical protein
MGDETEGAIPDDVSLEDEAHPARVRRATAMESRVRRDRVMRTSSLG